MAKSIPKIFISYSHDSTEHKQWVLDLATRLVHSGIDTTLDAWSLNLGDDIPHFMETQLMESDRVIMICSEKYVIKANKGSGGVGYEKMIVTASMMQSIDDNKVIPIIRQNGTCETPIFLKTKLYLITIEPQPVLITELASRACEYNLSITDPPSFPNQIFG